jgi:uncharacterized protein (TIGR02996 family)
MKFVKFIESQSENDAFTRILDMTPTDWATRLVYADWLYDNGEGISFSILKSKFGPKAHIHFSIAQRWMGDNHKCPEKNTTMKSSVWAWWLQGHDRHSMLESGIFNNLSQPKETNVCKYHSRQLAEEDLALALT